jgi:hypothetical protein
MIGSAHSARVAWLALTSLTGLACAGGASSDTGVTALLRLSGTGVQFIPGALGTESAADMPTMLGINISTNIVFPGATGRSLSGSANGSSAVLVGLDGDSGHWVVPTGMPDTDVAGAFDFQASLSLSPLLPLVPADRSVIFRAVDAQGTVGPPLSLGIKVQALTAAGGEPLVVTLQWDAEADLDLKLRVPNAANPSKPIDVWTKNRVALPPLGNSDPPYTNDDIKGAGQLDYDSNSNCVIDSLRQEDVVFSAAPPSGEYEVRIDAFSMCGQVAARWHAYATANGSERLGEAYGQAGDIDTQGSHGPATGTLAFRFTVP